ncbi:hypothetical protein CSAL01_05654 [Colletotrichum salicis]|uniref:Fungal N-terminal domain-containing protein n=1 Tax=Colletotrichum salicis TaxID=1209931 RepID=A0A135TJP1_9PEZI|nr:hypothetical protein CSAL01_05654 [Colletotrichum salicis]
MAEALGPAASAIAVVDMTAKVGSATFKLLKLWNEVKEVPAMLLEKAERIKDLEDFLLDAENHIHNSQLPQAFWNNPNHRLQQHIEKVRRALDEVQDTVEDLQAKLIARKDGFRSKLLSTKVVLRKEELRALDTRLDAALKLFFFAQMQWIMAMSALSTSLSIEERSRRAATSNTLTAEKKTNKVLASTAPALFYISTPVSILPTFRFGFGDHDSFQFSIQAPSCHPFLLYELPWLNQPQYRDLEPTLQKLFLDSFLDDYIEDSGQVSTFLDFNVSFSLFHFLLKRYRHVMKAFPVATRLYHLRLVVTRCSWETWEACTIVPEVQNLDVYPGILAYSKNFEEAALIHSFAMGMAGNFTRRSCHPDPDQWAEARKSWEKLLHDSIRLIGQWLDELALACNHHLSTSLPEWISILSSSDVELLDYGRQERSLYEQGLTNVQQRWAPWNVDTLGTTRYSLIGITYGSCPDHWKLWWTYEYEDYAGEFWNMIETEGNKMPGAWVDNSWDPDDYDHEEWDRWEAWEKEQPTPLIWSEYRKIRPPL